MTIEVEVVSKESIKPSSPTPDHLRHYQLSFLDQVVPTFFMPWVLFYPKEKSDANLSNIEQCERIKNSLSESLTIYYPLAGRVKDSLYIDCNDEGIPYVEATAKGKLSEYLENPNPGEQNKFLPYELDDVNELTAAFQVTFFDCGGLAIGLLISHKVADASSFFLFVNTWAAIARGVTDIVTPRFESAKLFPPETKLGYNPNQGMSMYKVVTKRFVFDASALAALRAKYSTDNTDIEYPRPTRFEALAAFFWTRFLAVTQPEADPDMLYTLFHAVNLRTRLDTPLSTDYFGNMSQSTVSVISRDTEDGFYGIVVPIRDAIKKVNTNYVKKLKESDGHLSFITENIEKFTRGQVTTLSFTSLCRFPVYEVDFGWGKPAWAGSAKLVYTNLVTFFDTKSGDGIEAWINLTEEDMAKFETDKELLTYAS